MVDIAALLPDRAGALDDLALAEHYSARIGSPWLRVNFVASVDGAATVEGKSGGLGGEADRRVFDVLRWLCDIVLVGAGTVRAEGYGPMRLDDAAVAARTARGLEPQPVFAIVSARLDLDPASTIFTGAPVKPIVVTCGSAPKKAMEALTEVADVIVAGDKDVDFAAAMAVLIERGLTRIHCEGGPSLFASLLAADVVDELCLTVSPVLVAGGAGRIATGEVPRPRDMALVGILRSDSMLLLRYLRDRS
jgi:riboflavin biosynthesis pyrimidine reductase